MESERLIKLQMISIITIISTRCQTHIKTPKTFLELSNQSSMNNEQTQSLWTLKIHLTNFFAITDLAFLYIILQLRKLDDKLEDLECPSLFEM